MNGIPNLGCGSLTRIEIEKISRINIINNVIQVPGLRDITILWQVERNFFIHQITMTCNKINNLII